MKTFLLYIMPLALTLAISLTQPARSFIAQQPSDQPVNINEELRPGPHPNAAVFQDFFAGGVCGCYFLRMLK
jgi:hypothetical protein